MERGLSCVTTWEGGEARHAEWHWGVQGPEGVCDTGDDERQGGGTFLRLRAAAAVAAALQV